MVNKRRDGPLKREVAYLRILPALLLPPHRTEGVFFKRVLLFYQRFLTGPSKPIPVRGSIVRISPQNGCQKV